MIHSILLLIRKELQLEFRQKYAIGGIILYVVSTVFVVYYSFVQIQPRVWNALYWIIMLFASINSLTKSFAQENSSRSLYYYTLLNPNALIIAKITYNILLLSALNLLSFLFFSLVAGNPVQILWLFVLCVVLGTVGFSIAFTFIAAIASKAENNATLMAILSFPVIIPILMLLIKLSAQALGLIPIFEVWKDIASLLSIEFILLAVVMVLFANLWRD